MPSSRLKARNSIPRGSSLKDNEVSKVIYEDFLPKALAEGSLLLRLIRILLGRGLSIYRRLSRFRRRGYLLRRLLFLCDAGIGGAGRLCGLEIRTRMHDKTPFICDKQCSVCLIPIDATSSPLPYVLGAFIGIALHFTYLAPLASMNLKGVQGPIP